MTKNYEYSAKSNERSENVMDILSEAEKKVNEKRSYDIVIPDKEAYESALNSSMNNRSLFQDEWRPDARSLSRREVNRRKAEDRLLLEEGCIVNIDINKIRNPSFYILNRNIFIMLRRIGTHL